MRAVLPFKFCIRLEIYVFFPKNVKTAKTFVLKNIEYYILPVDQVIEVVWIAHCGHILHVKLDPKNEGKNIIRNQPNTKM